MTEKHTPRLERGLTLACGNCGNVIDNRTKGSIAATARPLCGRCYLKKKRMERRKVIT